MRFTEYGKRLAQNEPLPAAGAIKGSTEHMEACAYDTGVTLLLTGKNAYGRRFRKEAKSVYGAFAKFHAAWGLTHAWHIREDGSRRLVFSR